MSLDELIDEFYRVRYKRQMPLYMVLTADTPTEMIIGRSPDTTDWIEWKLLERSNDIDPAFTVFEKEIGHKLPESFKRWHSRYYTLDGDISIVRLPEIPSNNPFGDLRSQMFDQYLPEALSKRGFIPFASDGNDVGPLCFDSSMIIDDNEWPIYVWDHEGDDSDKYLKLIFSNFRKLLECCTHLYGGQLAGYGELAEGISGFSVIDPEGAGNYFSKGLP